MSDLVKLALGLVGGLGIYAICALVFWYGMMMVPPYLILVLTILGVAGLAVAAVSGIVLLLGLIVRLADKIETKKAPH